MRAAAGGSRFSFLKDAGFKHFNNWTKLIRKGSEPLEKLTTEIKVRQIGPEDAETFGHIVCGAFGWPGLVRQWLVRLVGRPGWHHYLAYMDDEPIATGAMYVQNRIAWFGFASTIERFRRQGAQSALIHRRLKDAQAAECLNIVVETAEDTPAKQNPSYHNLLKFGFSLAYKRPNYLRVSDLQQ